MNYMSGKAAEKVTRFRTGSRRSGRSRKTSPPNEPTRTVRRAYSHELVAQHLGVLAGICKDPLDMIQALNSSANRTFESLCSLLCGA